MLSTESSTHTQPSATLAEHDPGFLECSVCTIRYYIIMSDCACSQELITGNIGSSWYISSELHVLSSRVWRL